MPGTGKTATTLEVINTLRIKKLNFSFLHINAMSLTNPNLVYTIIYESITGRRVAPASAALFLDEFFKKKDKTKLLTMEMNKGRINSKQEVSRNAEKMRVVLVDELDALVTKKQTLLYNLFDWPCHQNSKLLVISIANTMDLPERMQVKISSRIGNNRLVYEPYNLQ
jgi:origin recognition complex subunit 1